MDQKVTLDQYLMGRDKTAPIDDEMRTSALHLLSKINELLNHFYKAHPEASRRVVTSGYRPSAINAKVGGAAKSHHQSCRAVDLLDTDRKLMSFCLENLHILQELDLWMEDPRWTKGRVTNWVHLQIVSPKSGKRIFIPSSAPALDPNVWDGKYDKKYDKQS
jgi:hypothetical protein